MAMTITYVYGSNLYVNTTNRCNCSCTFCLRSLGDGVGTADSLGLEREPTREEILADIQARDAGQFRQLVFCGYGEPTFRLDDILWVCRRLKESGFPLPIRMDTNGHGDLICGRPVAREMAGLIDVLSISLNNATPEAYVARCRPAQGAAAYQAMLEFTREAVKYVPTVIMTVVDNMPPEEIEACRAICEGLGAQFRVRAYSASWKQPEDISGGRNT